jgi:hypothetical protein
MTKDNSIDHLEDVVGLHVGGHFLHCFRMVGAFFTFSQRGTFLHHRTQGGSFFTLFAQRGVVFYIFRAEGGSFLHFSRIGGYFFTVFAQRGAEIYFSLCFITYTVYTED